MGLGGTLAVCLVGMTGHLVEVEAHLAASVPGFTLVGLPDTSLAESRDRVRAAVASTGLVLPQRKVTVNLSPASLPKSGSGYDLAIAVAMLAGAGLVRHEGLARTVHLGELGLEQILDQVLVLHDEDQDAWGNIGHGALQQDATGVQGAGCCLSLSRGSQDRSRRRS
mgnify:CR=1 FL=1